MGIVLQTGATKDTMKSILIVDRDNQLRTMYESGLSGEGYKTFVAKSAEAAMRFLNSRDPHVDMIILDIDILSAGGIEMLERLLRSHKDTSVVLSSRDPRNSSETFTWLADAFIAKSNDLSYLKSTVRELLSVA